VNGRRRASNHLLVQPTGNPPNQRLVAPRPTSSSRANNREKRRDRAATTCLDACRFLPEHFSCLFPAAAVYKGSRLGSCHTTSSKKAADAPCSEKKRRAATSQWPTSPLSPTSNFAVVSPGWRAVPIQTQAILSAVQPAMPAVDRISRSTCDVSRLPTHASAE